MKIFVYPLILILLIVLIEGKGGGSRGGGGGRPSGSSHSGGNSNSKSQSQSNKKDHSNGNQSKNGVKGWSGGSGGSHNDDNNNKKQKSSSSKTGMALAGGLVAGGMLGYAAGHHHGHKNSTKCNTRKLPRTVNETSCCPSIPPPIAIDTSCKCDENDTSSFVPCVVGCTLEHEGWLDENGTIDKNMTNESILSNIKDKDSWEYAVPFVVDSCIGHETQFLKDSANETEIAYSNMEIVMCIRKGLIRQCPKDVKVDSRLCKKFFNFTKSCPSYPFNE